MRLHHAARKPKPKLSLKSVNVDLPFGDRMFDAFEAPIDPEDIDAIVDFLVGIRGTR